MTDRNELLDAVDGLTRTRITKVLQFNDAGISCTSEIEHDPRLQHLRQAIVGGIGSHDGGGNGADRLPFDAGALALYDHIEATISIWYVELTGKPVYLTPEQTLRQWYIAFDNDHRAGNASDDTREKRTRVLQKWALEIDGRFDPRKQIELTVTIREPIMVPVVRYRLSESGHREPVTLTDDAGLPRMKPKLHWRTKEAMTRIVERRPASCPECGENTAHDPKTGDKILALILEYRDESVRTIDHATIRCRSCDTVWEGRSGCRSVAWEIEQEEQRLNEDHGARHVVGSLT